MADDELSFALSGWKWRSGGGGADWVVIWGRGGGDYKGIYNARGLGEVLR
jgi:hypothetical protein